MTKGVCDYIYKVKIMKVKNYNFVNFNVVDRFRDPSLNPSATLEFTKLKKKYNFLNFNDADGFRDPLSDLYIHSQR